MRLFIHACQQHSYVLLIKYTTDVATVSGGPLEIPGGGGGGKFPPKSRAKKNAWKNIRAAITSEKKIIVQANSKVQIVLKKNSCRG